MLRTMGVPRAKATPKAARNRVEPSSKYVRADTRQPGLGVPKRTLGSFEEFPVDVVPEGRER